MEVPEWLRLLSRTCELDVMVIRLRLVADDYELRTACLGSFHKILPISGVF